MMTRLWNLAGLCIAGVLLIVQFCRAGNVTSDGSLGAGAVLHQGNTFIVPRSAGRLVGSNLFQSLSTLNLDTGETANFTGPAQVSNVLTRVTGGPSTINGTLQCSIPNANFYLINPAGVVFGPDASLNVGGSFAVTTADVIHLADGGTFNADVAANSVLTTAAPAAFGFLHSSPASITVNGGAITTDDSGTSHLHPSLNPAPSGSLTVIGGNITINGGELATPGTGAALIVSVGSPGTVNLSNPTDASSFSSMGTVTVISGGLLGSDASSSGGVDSGLVKIVAGNVIVNGNDPTDTVVSKLGSFSGTGKSGDVIAVVTGTVSVTGGGELGSDAQNATSAANVGTDSGSVSISASDVTVSGTDTSDNFQSLVGSFSGTGEAGPVTLTATGALTISAGSEVGSDATNPSNTNITGTNSGAVTISAGGISISGADASDTFESSLGSFPGSGNSGDVGVMAQSLSIRAGGFLAADTSASGAGGNVNVQISGMLALDGSGASSTDFTGISSASLQTTPGGGPGGDINVSAGMLTIAGGASINANTGGTGAGGNIQVAAGTLTILSDGGIIASTLGTGAGGKVTVIISGALTLDGAAGPNGNTGIFADSVSTTAEGGKGGDVTVSAETISILNGAQIDASTSCSGAGGNVTVAAGTIKLDGLNASGNLTGISSQSVQDTPGGGPSGDVHVSTGMLSITNNAEIGVTTLGTGPGGNIIVVVSGNITMDTASLPNDFDGIVADSLLSTPGGGKGGEIMVSAAAISILNGAQISANTSSTGSAGNITVAAGTMMLDNGGNITSDSLQKTVDGGSGGNVHVSAAVLTITKGSQIDASTLGSGSGGEITVTVSGALTLDGAAAPDALTGITAESALETPGGGKGGNINVSAASLSILNGAEIQASTFGAGAGADINILVSGAMTLNGGASSNGFTGISAQSNLVAPGGGNGGNILLTTKSLSISNGAEISAASLSDGAAGNVTITASGAVALQSGSLLSVSSLSGNSGDLVVTANADIFCFDSNITTQAGNNGGNIILASPGVILLRNTPMTAKAQNNGGNITIDPVLVILDHSPLSADAVNGTGGAISITTSNGLLQSDSPISASSTFGLQGTVTLITPPLDVAAGLLVLPQPTFGGRVQLVPTCFQMSTEDLSSFVLTGHGGLPIEPGGWLPFFQPVAPIQSDSDLHK
jgi:filamentous hemagglutinin family protein